MTGPSSERTADAEHQAMLAAIYKWLPDGWDQIDPVPQYEGLLQCEALDYVDRLVARNQQLQEALDRIASGDINWQACKAEARAALASVRARSET